jgi:uncharacterized oligopeptide transporter (OPT) family protein
MISLSLRSWITFFGLAILMGLNNIYSTLLTGWGEGGSIVAVILSLLFLAKAERSIINYNLGQTMASAGGSVGFTVAIIASIYYIEPNWDPPLFTLSLMVMGLSLMGVAMAVPLRRTIVHWFFPSGVACATILRAVTSDQQHERVRARNIMGASGLTSAFLTLPTKAAIQEGGTALWQRLALPGGLAISLDPLLYGIGIVIGPRIGISMLVGALFNHYLLIPNFGDGVSEFNRWAAVGLMTLPAFTSVLFAFFLKSHGELPPGFHPQDSAAPLSKRQWALIFTVFIFSMGMTMMSMDSLFGVNWIYAIACAVIAAPLCFALGKVASETDINPVRLLAIILLFIFSLTGSFGPVTLLGVGVAGAALASIAVDLFIDLRTGYLINADPKQQVFMQFLGVIPVSLVSIYFLHLLAVNFGFGEGKYFPAPGAVVWASMAEVFADGSASLSPFIWKILGVTSVLGIIMTLLENWKPLKAVAPSPFAMGIALLLPIEMSVAICAGSLIRQCALFFAADKHQAKADAFQAGSAIFAASALAGIIAVTLISLGILYLPAH